MYDLLTAMKYATLNDIVRLNGRIQTNGFIVYPTTYLYFVELDTVKQVVIASLDIENLQSN